MPEARPAFRPPTIIAGTVLESGVPNTGQWPVTFGSTRTFTRFSGVVGPDVAIWVGGGQLHQGQIIPNAEQAGSGLPIIFYDTATVASGGPFNASGHKVLGILNDIPGQSGDITAGAQCVFNTVFTSGLVVATTSGMPGFTVSFTPVISG